MSDSTSESIAGLAADLLGRSHQASDYATDRVSSMVSDVDDVVVDATSAIVSALDGVRLAILHASSVQAIGIGVGARAASRHDEITAGWYDVELFGHRSRIGHLTTVTVGGKPIVQIREPAHQRLDNEPPRGEPTVEPERIEFYAAAAIFSLTPIDEATAIKRLVIRDDNTIPF